jgi:hypothetical protein
MKAVRQKMNYIKDLNAKKSDLVRIVKNPKLLYIVASKITDKEFSVFGIIQGNQRRREK